MQQRAPQLHPHLLPFPLQLALAAAAAPAAAAAIQLLAQPHRQLLLRTE
jgi:hypothetical protein